MISTGRVITNYLESNGFTLNDLSQAADVSERTVFRMLSSGESPLSYEVASAVHSLIPEIETSFLMKYDAEYQTRLKEAAAELGVKDINAVLKEYKADKLYKHERFDKLSLIKRIVSVFGEENIRQGRIDTSGLSLNYSKANNADDNATLLWVKAAYEECKTDSESLLSFNEKGVKETLEFLKNGSDVTSLESAVFNMKAFAQMCGINLYYRPSIPNSRVKAVIVKDSEGYVYILMSDLFKCIENLWLSFAHEIMHADEKDFDLARDRSEIEIADNENFIEGETIRFFVGNSMDKYNECNVQNLFDLVEETKCPIGIAAELLRFKTNKYNVPEVNKFIHYYKQDDFVRLLCD